MAGQTSYAAMKSHYYFFFEGKKVITNCELKLYESRLYLELGSQIRGCYKTHMRVYIWNGCQCIGNVVYQNQQRGKGRIDVRKYRHHLATLSMKISGFFIFM